MVIVGRENLVFMHRQFLVIPDTVNQEIFIQDFFVFVIFMFFNFIFFVPEPNVKCIFKFLILDNENS